MLDAFTKSIQANFSAGPALLPDDVNKRLADLFVNRCQSGYSILEVSHRSIDFDYLRESLFAKLRDVLGVPDNFSILLLPGGGRGQYAAVPMNFISKNRPAVYLNTGYWGDSAYNEASKYGKVLLTNAGLVDDDIAYFFYVDNETVSGNYFSLKQEFSHKRVVCDMSSSLLAYNIDFNKVGLIFAATQKNIGMPGNALVIVKNDWLNCSEPMVQTPSIFNYKQQLSKQSLLNTPCNITWLTALFMLDWISDSGGLSCLQAKLVESSSNFYAFLDSSSFYKALVAPEFRSITNITFATPSVSLDALCLKFLQDNNILGLKGHSVQGHLRASLYIGCNHNHVTLLIDSLKEFERTYG